MRQPTDLPRRPRRVRRSRLALVVVAAALIVLLFSLRGIAGFYTDYLWFDAQGLTGVWSNVLGAKIALAVVFTAMFFLVCWGNLWIADRIAPRFSPAGPEQEVIDRFREAVGNRIGLVRVALALVLALIAGVGVSGRWNDWILFRNSVDFGVTDPLHDTDVGFYVFRLPFLSFLVDWAFASLVVILIVTAAGHYVNGGIRFQAPGPRVTPQVKVHLSVLLGVLALLRTADYWLQRYELNFSSRGVVNGASYTDINAQLPALNLLVIISVAAAILFLVNIRLRGWVLPIIAVGLWAFVALIVATLYPTFVQRFQVEPSESEKEALYIERNIENTRMAFDIGAIEINNFAYNEDLTAGDLEENGETIRNIRLWEPDILSRTYQRLQEVRGFYRFNDVDVDRYEIDGRTTQVVLSARELNPNSDQTTGSWENQRVAYTHGYGAVLSPANSVTADGQPDFVVKDVPPQGDPEITQPAIYFGEDLPAYAVLNTSRDEIDYPTEAGLEQSRYDGAGGVGIGSFFRRAAFALRFGDVNPIISDLMTGDSKIIYNRDVRDRVETAAPFLEYDADPYPVVLDGRIFWIIDAYTTTSNYPYSQDADTERLPDGSGLKTGFNYVRNSVKVVVDAYHGTMRFYVVDDEDPIINAYQKAFPELFTSADEIPDGLRAHFRYPEDLFRVQTNMWGRYHITDPSGFYSRSDEWNISQDPGTGAITDQPNTETRVAPDGTIVSTREIRMDPYYLLMRLPGETSEGFLMLQPFVPFSEDDSRKELSAFMIAKSDPEEYGELEVFVMPRGTQVDGPSIVDARINQETAVAEQITLLNREGSRVLWGNLLVIPIENSLLYVRPLYVQASGTEVPELKRVVVVFGDQVVMRNTLAESLQVAFGDAPVTEEEPRQDDDVPSPGVSSDLAALLQQQAEAFAAADQALREGDLATYQERIAEARSLNDQIREQTEGGDGTTTTTTEPPQDA